MANTALITGSYGGLGTCFVNIHGAARGDLILVGRSQAKIDKQAAEAEKKYGVTAHTIAVDLSEPDTAQFIYDTCKQNGWQVDIIINNAGFGGQGDFARERTMEQDMSMIAVNVETPTRILKLFLPDMTKRGSGRVLNVSSTAATLQRKLSEENTSFQKQLNNTREILALHYLNHTDMSTNDIAYLLGYSELNSFLRAFTIWTGKSISNYKKNRSE